jgi:hypothetical protein
VYIIIRKKNSNNNNNKYVDGDAERGNVILFEKVYLRRRPAVVSCAETRNAARVVEAVTVGAAGRRSDNIEPLSININ